MGSYHQASEAIEVVFNKTKYDSLAKEQQQILRLAGQAAAADDGWKAWDIYSKDLETLITKHNVRSSARRKRSSRLNSRPGTRWSMRSVRIRTQGPFIKKVLESQKAWGKRVGFYAINNEADFKSAYEHYFGRLRSE